MKRFVGITGTTSVGKSAVAVELAKRLGSEIISADSMQVYKGMNVGTAKISLQDMQGVKHHMLDVVDPNQNFSSFLYQQQASAIIDGMQCLPIVVGGTGFYFDSLLYPPQFGNASEERRKQLKEMLERNGLQAMQKLLQSLDADLFADIDLNNPKRVLRAIEIAENGGGKFTDKSNRTPNYDAKLFVLQRDRQQLYEQIDSRVDQMIANGLVQEVQGLLSAYGNCDSSAFSAIGYKEIISYLLGNCSLQQAIEQIKLNTRHYAKRQITYFKKMNVAMFVDVQGKTVAQIADVIMANLW